MDILIAKDAPERSPFSIYNSHLENVPRWHLSDEFCHNAAPIDDKDSARKSFIIHKCALLTQKR